MALELALEAHFLSTASILAAAQVSKRWRDEVDKCALWSAANVKRVEQRVDAAQAAVAAADAMQQLAAGPVRRRQASAIGQLPVETRPKLVNFVTGAIHFASIARLVGAARLEAGESFVDLGCGAGFQLAAACVLVPLREVIGLELLRGYLDCATKMFDQLCVSTCFEEIQMARIAENCRALRAGARVITLDRLLPTAHFGLVCRVQVQGEWGSAKGYVWLRNHAP